ncbi:MAG: 50S ribosomal protein L15 [bacterium]
MTITALDFVKRSRKKRKRVGRGNASGLGGECGRGHKGQKSRSGYKRRFGFEGGQMPLYRRIPKKRGFRNPFKIEYVPINLGIISKLFVDGESVEPEALLKKGIIKRNDKYKILGFGDFSSKLTIKAHAFSKSAMSKIEASKSSTENLL